jgi:hypothetical protein
MVAWYLAAAAAMLAARLPFAKAAIIPFYLEFQPAIVLVPLAGIFWGPAGALGVTTASLLGDWLLGYWCVLSPFRAIGVFLFAFSANRLWDFCGAHQGHGLTPRWGHTARFVVVAWVGCLVAAAWPAAAADVFGLYPFPYYGALLILHHAVFTTLLGPAFYRVLARDMVPHFGCWRQTMGYTPKRDEVMAVRAVLYHIAGAVGACGLGMLAGGLAYGIWPDRAWVLSTTTGWAVYLVVVPCLILQVGGLFWPRGRFREPPR